MQPMMQLDTAIKELTSSKEFFDRSTRVLEESDSGFRPKEETMTVAQQVAHVAFTIDWFIEGASRQEGFDLDFERAAKELEKVQSLAEARQLLTKAYDNAIQFIHARTAAQLAQPLPPGPVMGGEPIHNVFIAMIEHTAHHRGALTVYSRLLGKVPPMPYMDM